jgi:hypothetical protein
MQCYNWQHFGHTGVMCKQTPHYVWCQREDLERANRNAETAKGGIPASTEAVVVQQTNTNAGHQIPRGHTTAYVLATLRTCATPAATSSPEVTAPEDHTVETTEPLTDKCSSDGDIVTLITTVQHTLT